MHDLTLARVLHVLAVVAWIGGVAMVTTVLLPAVRRIESGHRRVELFEAIEGRFAWQARFTTLLAGLTGFYMVYRLHAWSWFLLPRMWYLHAMVGVWALFTFMLFVAEPLFLHRWLRARAQVDPDGTFALIQRLHWVLLGLSLLTLAGTVAGAHGLFFF